MACVQVLWTQGCPNHCPGCQNPETWDFNGGMLVRYRRDIMSCPASSRSNPCTHLFLRRAFRPARRLLGKSPIVAARTHVGMLLVILGSYLCENLRNGRRTSSIHSNLSTPSSMGHSSSPSATHPIKFRGSRNQLLLHLLQYGTGEIHQDE